jgi:hypothetical protein
VSSETVLFNVETEWYKKEYEKCGGDPEKAERERDELLKEPGVWDAYKKLAEKPPWKDALSMLKECSDE